MPSSADQKVVVAAELISGGGQSSGDGGLGFLVWNAYQGGDLPRVVVAMLSLGVAGYLASALVRPGLGLADRGFERRIAQLAR